MSTFRKFKPTGNPMPYTEAPYVNSEFYSPYFNETHEALRAEIRAFVDEFIKPFVDDWDASGEIDPQLYKEFGKRGYLAALAGQHKWPMEYTDVRIKSVPPEKFDFLHETIITEEISRAGSGGVVWFLMGGYNISVPAIFSFASDEVKRRVLPELLDGRKRSCLAITEPDAGSDVANLTTTAVRKGDRYVVSGTKKWITNGIFSDYFVTAVRTGGAGAAGVSMVLVERDAAVSTRKILTQGMLGSGTTLVNFEDVEVPVGNLLFKENQGFKCIVTNFNHERLAIIYQVIGMCRVVLEDCFAWAEQRETFGQKLIEHAVIRGKLGVMVGRVEALQAYANDLACQYKLNPAHPGLGGPIALCKAVASQTIEFCAREGTQIFGGLGYTRGGKGGRVERVYREVRAFAIPGGSEEIMIDLGVRQGLKYAQTKM